MSYPCDLSDRELETIRHHFEFSNGYGNRRKNPIRETINAILYLVKPDCQWRQLSNDFTNLKTVYTFYRRFCLKVIWESLLDELNQLSRQKAGVLHRLHMPLSMLKTLKPHQVLSQKK